MYSRAAKNTLLTWAITAFVGALIITSVLVQYNGISKFSYFFISTLAFGTVILLPAITVHHFLAVAVSNKNFSRDAIRAFRILAGAVTTTITCFAYNKICNARAETAFLIPMAIMSIGFSIPFAACVLATDYKKGLRFPKFDILSHRQEAETMDGQSKT
jgi:hypothetical protein